MVGFGFPDSNGLQHGSFGDKPLTTSVGRPAGRVEQCQALHALPYMERAVVGALMTRRYAPATLSGKPLAVRYVFHVKLVMPR